MNASTSAIAKEFPAVEYLAAGDVIRVGRSRYMWRVQAVQPRRSGLLLVCYGPIGGAFPCGGHCLWIGRKALRLRSPVGGWMTLDPIDPERIGWSSSAQPTDAAGGDARRMASAGRKGGR